MSRSTLTKDYAIGGVYMIVNTFNGKMLIGTAHDFDEHRKITLRNLMNGHHKNRELQKDFDEGHRFKYKVLYHTILPKERYEHENWRPLRKKAEEYIKQYEALDKGYNLPYGTGLKIIRQMMRETSE